ncbi:apolipophorins-like [Contarinia nasturtii]|uniref:apolipophorins-like n=1 Tax=Contarinia nasturtii TaxID=265458 RepID=UPI0012D4416A|nr:apolipophorins-like [Contarinia nasturtii]
MLKFTLFLISVVFFNCIFAAPLNKQGNGCKQGCPSTSKGSKLKYQPGQVYSYNFESTVSISLTGNDPQDIQLQVQGTAHVHGYSNCQYGLDLHDVTLIGPDKGKTKFNSKLQLSKIVQFTLSDDKLESEICASPDDSDVSLNIKRALISLLQLNDGAAEEVDIFGKCQTNYAVTKNDDGSYVVTKTRDLNECSHRENFVSGIITGVFNENSNIKSTPLLTGDFTNEVRVNRNGIVESAQVVEDYVLVPFSNGEAGVRARVVTSFRLKDQKPNGGETLSVSVPRSLIYESVKKPQAVNYKTAKESLFGICKTYELRKNTVGAQVAGQFTETIRLLRYLKKDDILLLHKDASNPICRKVFLDAVFRVASAESINAIASLLENNKIHEKRLAYLSFNLATSVNKETINILTKLLEKDVLKEGYLSIGNLVKKYIQDGNENDADLVKLLDKLADKLGNCKSAKRHQEDMIVAILKGLRGAKGITGSLLDKLVKCASEGNAGRVRAAAIQAFASASCDNKIQSAALNLLKNRKDDSEFRIEAYLALVDCSSPEIADEVSKLLDDEPVYQVGSFIVSHLKNLRASTDLYREKARKDFADVTASQKFPNDIRKFSFNHEFSYEFGSLGLGGSIDSNVIYSQKSFTPRSLRTNLTGELFGTSFNIFELSGRQENFDLVLERYFGPQGYFKTLNKQEALSKIHDYVTGGAYRPKRSIAQDADNFGKDYVGSSGRDVDFDFSVKMFGSELYFLSLGDNLPSESKDFTKEFGRLLQNFLKDTKERKKKQYEVHALFLDAEFSYPTSSGFPLKIQSQGAGAFRLEASLKADIKDIQANPKNTKFAVSVSPSYNVQLTGIISVDGYEITTGVNVTSNVHSATGAQLSFELLNQGKGVDVKVDFPLKKQEILSFTHDIVFIQQNLGHPSITHNLKSAQKKDVSNNEDCFDQFQKYLGVTVCYELKYKKGEKLANSRLFPLNGPVHASAYIEIEKQYHFNAAYDDSVQQKRTLELVFDTPESVDKRKVSVKFEGAIQPKAYLSAEIVSPYKSVKAEIGVNNDDKELTIYGQAKSDALQYLLKFGFRKSGSGTRREYTPIIEYNNPEAIPYKVSGKLIVDSSQPPKMRYNFEKLTIEPAQSDGKFGPLVFDGWFEHEKLEHFETAMDVKYKDNTANIKGNVIAKNQELDLDLSLLSDVAEFANGRVKFHYKRGQKQCKNSFVFVYGRDLESTTKRIELTTDYEFEKKDDKYVSIAGKNTLIISPIPIKLVLNGGYRAGHFDYEFIGGYAKSEVASKLNADVNKKSKGDWNIKINGAVNNHNFELISSRDIDDAAQRSVVKNELKSSCGASVSVNAKFDNNFSTQKIDFAADGVIVVGRGQKPLKLDFKFVLNPKNAQSNGKLLADNAEVISFNAVLNRNEGNVNNPTTAKLDISVPDFVSAHGDYNSLKGKGKSEFIVTFQKFDRKVKVVSNYELGANKFDLRNDFYYNFEKDNSRHVVFETKNKYPSNSFESVNEVDINGEKFHFAIDGSKTGSFKNGKQNGKFTLRLPTQREIVGTLDRQVDYTSAKATLYSVAKITDTIAQGGRKQRSVELSYTLKDGDREKRLFDVYQKLTLTDFDSKSIVVDTHFSHLPKGSYKSALANVKVSGSVPHPVELNVGIDEYGAVHAVYNANFKYGNAGAVQLDGSFKALKNEENAYQTEAELKIDGKKYKVSNVVVASHLSPSFTLDVYYPQEKHSQVAVAVNRIADRKHKLSVRLVNINSLQLTGDVELSYPSVENFGLIIDLDSAALKANKLHIDIHSKQSGNKKGIEFSATEQNKNIISGTVDYSVKQENGKEDAYQTEVELKIVDKKYKLSNVVVASNLSPSFTLDVYYPQEKHSQIAVVVSRIADRKHKLSVRLVNINSFQLTSDVELSYQSVENFGLIIDLDSAALKANKLHIDIHSKQSGNNKGIEFSATEQNRNIISGTADYSVKQEKGKSTIEGKGNVNWYDKSSALTFQFVRSTFNQAENNETGFSLVFNGQIGPKNVQAELKATNREFHLQQTICESDKPCVHLKVTSILSDVDWKHFTHNLLVTFNLRSLGFPHEFNLKADTKRDGYFIEHTFDTQIQSADQNKYQFNAFVKPTTAGIVLSIPKRTAAVEATFAYPKDVIGVYQATITSYLDKKNNPGKHSTIGFKGELKRPGKMAFIATGALVASHPSVKELKISGESEFNADKRLISGSLTFDVFKNTNQAIVVAAKYANSDSSSKGFNLTSELSLKSQGLGLNYVFRDNAGVSFARRAVSYTYEFRGPTAKERFGVYLVGDPKKVDFSIVLFDEELVKGSGEVDVAKKTASIQSTYKLLGTEPIHSHATASLNAFNANIKQGNFFSIQADVAAAKALSFKAIGNQKTLLNFNVALDQANLLSTNYDVNDKEFKEFLKSARTKLAEDAKQARNEFESRINQAKNLLTTQVNSVKENLPDFSKLNADYKEEFENFSDDLLADKSIKELVDLFKHTYEAINKPVSELLRASIENFKQVSKTINEFFKQLYEGFNERILPSLKESYNHIEQTLSSVFDELFSSLAHLFERLVESLKKFEYDFKKIGKSASEWSKGAGKVLGEQWSIIQRELEDIYKLIFDHLKSLPGLEVIKEKYNELVQRIPVSDAEELKKLAEKPLATLKKWLEWTQERLQSLGVDSADDYYGLPFVWFQKNIHYFPKLTTMKLSILNYAMHEPLPSLKDVLLTYRPYAFNPLYLVPPFPIEGHVVEGEHLFTFSGDQLTLPGAACNYVLAKDIVDGNFTVLAKIVDKKLQSISLVDKSGESIELAANGKLSVNDKANEFPVLEKSLYAWRTYYSASLYSTYGVQILCALDLKVCHITVNGFYFSKLRGLLGNGGYEQYDAKSLPNGKISDSSSQFVNAYKLVNSCPDVSIDEQHKHSDDAKSPECEKVFGSSSLRYASYILDSKQYFEACEHAVKSAANKQQVACNVGFGYASYARLQNVPVSMPSICQKCEVIDDNKNVNSYEIGERYTVDSGKKADIVFVVDTAIESKSLTDLVQHFVTELRKQLKKEYDAHISVIGYKKGEKYLSHYTTDGKLDVSNFHLPKNLEYMPKEEKIVSLNCKYMDPILQTLYDTSIKIQEELSLLADGRAFREALNYPFRSNAHRSIVAIRSDVLQHSSNPIKLLGAKAVNEIAKGMGINLHLLAPTPELKFDNNKEVNNIVGFSDKQVLYLPGQKKHSADRQHLQYGLDLGIDMVSENHGYAFSLTNYNALDAPNQKSFVKIAAQHIAQQITKTESVHECVCILNHGLFPREYCRETDRNIKNRK